MEYGKLLLVFSGYSSTVGMYMPMMCMCLCLYIYLHILYPQYILPLCINICPPQNVILSYVLLCNLVLYFLIEHKHILCQKYVHIFIYKDPIYTSWVMFDSTNHLILKILFISLYSIRKGSIINIF